MCLSHSEMIAYWKSAPHVSQPYSASNFLLGCSCGILFIWTYTANIIIFRWIEVFNLSVENQVIGATRFFFRRSPPPSVLNVRTRLSVSPLITLMRPMNLEVASNLYLRKLINNIIVCKQNEIQGSIWRGLLHFSEQIGVNQLTCVRRSNATY